MAAERLNAAQRWFLEERGITPDTLARLGVETTDSEARWKVGDRYKIRKGFKPGEPRDFFYSEKGPFKPWLLPVKDANITDPVICFEGETDAMRTWQDGREKYGMIAAIPGVDAYTEAVAKTINKLSAKAPLFFVLDNDEVGGSNGGPDQVDDAWSRIKSRSPRARRVVLPQEYKDVCAYRAFYSLEDFDKLLQAAATKTYHYDNFDIVGTGKKTDPSWLWQNCLPHGMFGFIQGNGNVGKSWINMALAVAIAERWPTFMGLPLDVRKGRAMLVDNENPEPVVRHRLAQLGLQPENQKHMRIYHHRVRLDQHPERLIEDIETFDPDFVGLDSLTSLSDQDENSVNAIGTMFAKAVIPISRDLGVATFLLHHVNRFSGGAQVRTRGGEHIANHTDIAWDMREDSMGGNDHVKVLSRFRNRTGAIPHRLNFLIEDMPHGRIDMKLLDDTVDGVM